MGKVESATAGLRPLYLFEQLVIGSHNQFAVGACQEVLRTPGETYNPLFVYGPPGVGKTHLMQAVAHQMLQQNPAFKVRYISAERFMSEVLTAISEDRMLEVRRSYSVLDLLIVDDVQYLTESKISQEELFHVFNNLHQANRQVILAADRPPNQLTTLNNNIRTRLEWGLAADVKIPDEATRLQILQRKQTQLPGLVMDDAMLTYVSRALHSNVRELEGFLKRIHAYVTLSHQVLSLNLVKTVVKEILPEGTPDLVVDMTTPIAAAPVVAPLPVADVPPPPPPAPVAPPPPVAVVPPPPPAPVAPPPPVAVVPPPPPAPVAPPPPVAVVPPPPPAPVAPPPPPAPVEPPPPVAVIPPPPVPPVSNGNGFHISELLTELPNDPPVLSPEMFMEDTAPQKPSTPSPAPDPLMDISFSAPKPPVPDAMTFEVLLQSMDTPAAAPAPSAPAVPAPAAASAPTAFFDMNAPRTEEAAVVNMSSVPVQAPVPELKVVMPPDPVPAAEPEPVLDESDDAALGHKDIGAVFFYPEGANEALETVHRKFQDVIKKHKLKFRLKRAHSEPYAYKGKINYSSFVDVCKQNKVPVAIVIGPPPDSGAPQQDFYDLLTVTLDVQGVSLQLVNWSEINKDYRYLNLALDIALVRSR